MVNVRRTEKKMFYIRNTKYEQGSGRPSDCSANDVFSLITLAGNGVTILSKYRSALIKSSALC